MTDEKKLVPDCPSIPPAPLKKKDGQGDNLYILKYPLNLGARTVDSVAPRILTGKDMLETEHEIKAMRPEADYASIGQAERMMRLIGKSCGLIFEDVQRMDARDINALSQKVSAFL